MTKPNDMKGNFYITKKSLLGETNIQTISMPPADEFLIN